MTWPRHLAMNLKHNPHRAVRQNLHAYLYDNNISAQYIPPGELEKIIVTDELWILRWWLDPETSHLTAASTLEAALLFACEIDGTADKGKI